MNCFVNFLLIGSGQRVVSCGSSRYPVLQPPDWMWSTFRKIPVDHFEDASFRQKYFSPEGSYKAEKKLREAELQKTEDQLKTIKVDDT